MRSVDFCSIARWVARGERVVIASVYTTGPKLETLAPSMRMVVDLSSLDRSRWVNQTGVSGHPGDDHYDDQIDAWLEGEDYAWPFSRKAVESAEEDRQTFTPGGSGSGDS